MYMCIYKASTEISGKPAEAFPLFVYEYFNDLEAHPLAVAWMSCALCFPAKYICISKSSILAEEIPRFVYRNF